MATDHIAGLLIPYDRVNVTEFVQATAKLLILRISQLKVDARVIDSCIELVNRYDSDVHKVLLCV
ncbi:hypothetical protein D3C81_2081810 [compost metagenome]